MEYPAGVEWMTDLSAATWIEGRLAEWKDPLPIPVGTILPEGFEAYARVSIRSAPMARTVPMERVRR